MLQCQHIHALFRVPLFERGDGGARDYDVVGCGHSISHTALVFDYKSFVDKSNTLTCAKATCRVQTRAGFDCPKVTVILQKRWEDECGNVYASRVGTAALLIKNTQTKWQNGAKLPIVYGDIPDAIPADMRVGAYVCKTLNKHDKMVKVQEVGYTTDAPTHIIIQFSAGCHEAFVGQVGNILWVDNIRLDYE